MLKVGPRGLGVLRESGRSSPHLQVQRPARKRSLSQELTS